MRWILGFLVSGLIILSCTKDTIVTPQAQLKLDTTSIDAFLKQNNITATKLPSGMWYRIDSLALGVYPVLTDSVVLSYSAKLIPSLTIVDNISISDSLTVLLSSAIAGIQQGLTNFPSGSIGELYVPSGLAFGTNSHTGASSNYLIPANANLLYKIKLKNVKGTQLTNDLTSINNYIIGILDSLVSYSISPFTDPLSGLRYAYDSSKTSTTYAALKDSVYVTYSYKILNTTAFITSDTTVRVALKNQITGWKILIPKIPEGATATLYVPSGYGYGSTTSSRIPANSNLVYQLTLTKVIHNP